MKSNLLYNFREWRELDEDYDIIFENDEGVSMIYSSVLQSS